MKASFLFETIQSVIQVYGDVDIHITGASKNLRYEAGCASVEIWYQTPTGDLISSLEGYIKNYSLTELKVIAVNILIVASDESEFQSTE